jgi:hypothetical protein
MGEGPAWRAEGTTCTPRAESNQAKELLGGSSSVKEKSNNACVRAWIASPANSRILMTQNSAAIAVCVLIFRLAR